MKDYSASYGSYNPKTYIKNITLEQPSQQKRKEVSNKTFFTNIKAQLNNIRSDVTKLVNKDNSKPMGINKSYGSAQKSDNYSNDGLIESKLERKIFAEQVSIYAVSSKINLEQKLFQIENQLKEELRRKQQVIGQLEEERKNQALLRNQINQLREINFNYEQQIHSRNKQEESLKQHHHREMQQTRNYIQKQQEEIAKLRADIQSIPRHDSQNIEKAMQLDNKTKNMQDNIRHLQDENCRLRGELSSLQRQKQAEIMAIVNNYEQKIHRTESKSMKELGSMFESKVNELLDENYSLKNKIGYLESQLQTQRIQMESLKSTIQAYEARDREMGPGASQSQLRNLREKIMQLQEQNDKLQSDHQFQIMKLQNQIDELRVNPHGKIEQNQNFNQILSDQIKEIEALKQKIREKNELLHKTKK